MRVLIACEFSGIVREAFRARGHDAWSCDLLPTEIPGQHIQDDVLKHLNDGWDMMIAHPPCRYLSNACIEAFSRQPERTQKMLKAARFFNSLLKASIPHIAVENPIQHGLAREHIRKYDQKIQPYYFGEPQKKTTCLWLKNLPELKPTKIVEVKPRAIYTKADGRKYYCWYHQGKNSHERSRSFKSIARAMAAQWGSKRKKEVSE